MQPTTTVLDSLLFRDAFGTPAIRAVFSDRTLVERYIEVEIALARAEAACGTIPADAADEIAAKANFDGLDLDLLRHETDNVGYPILPLVQQLVKQCGEAGRYVHWGATTQDIMDTADVLRIRAGLDIVEADIATLRLAGFDEAAVIEIVANVAVNVLTNYINNVAETDIDFPIVLAAQAA